MIRIKNLCFVLVLVAGLAFAAAAAPVAPWIDMYVSGDTAAWLLNNTTGVTANILHLEFGEEVTISNAFAIGGGTGMFSMGPLTGTTFDFVGSLIKDGTMEVDLPVGVVPALAQWLKLDEVGNTIPIGPPFFTSVTVLGRLFGVGIVAVREANPAALLAGFEQFFADNEEYLAGLAATIGINLADSLMPIIMASPAEGIENFFNTIMGMLGITSLSEVVGGNVNWSALFTMLGM